VTHSIYVTKVFEGLPAVRVGLKQSKPEPST
jgi:hypothetical protein